MSGGDRAAIEAIAHIHSPFASKFGVPRQSGLVEGVQATVVFCPKYRSAEAVRGLELLCAEEEDPDAREELDRAGRDLHAYLLGISAGAAAIQKLLERLDAHNTESLHLS